MARQGRVWLQFLEVGHARVWHGKVRRGKLWNGVVWITVFKGKVRQAVVGFAGEW